MLGEPYGISVHAPQSPSSGRAPPWPVSGSTPRTADFWNKKPPVAVDPRGNRPPDHQIAVGQGRQRRTYAPGENPVVERRAAAIPQRQPEGGGYPGRRAVPAAESASPASAVSAFPAWAAADVPATAAAATDAARLPPTRARCAGKAPCPIQDAMKAGPPEAFDGHYVICVNGIPLMGGSRYQGERRFRLRPPPGTGRYGPPQGPEQPAGQGQGSRPGGPRGRARSVPDRASSSVFPKNCCRCTRNDSEVIFTTQLGRLVVKAHFLLKEMLYHGELAV